MTTSQQLLKLVNSRYDSSGYQCKFFLTGDVGLKVYKTELERNMAANLQKTAWFVGEAPEVYESIDIDENNYGYITEVLKVDKLETEEVNEAIYRIYKKTGLVATDTHSNNFGRLKDGTLVFIDFGMGAFELLCTTYINFHSPEDLTTVIDELNKQFALVENDFNKTCTKTGLKFSNGTMYIITTNGLIFQDGHYRRMDKVIKDIAERLAVRFKD